MKQTVFLFCLLPVCVLAQVKDSTIAFNKANRIIIKTNRPAKDNFTVLQSVLMGNQFEIQSTNEDSLVVHTKGKRYKSGSFFYQVDGLAKDNEIILSGKYGTAVDFSYDGVRQRVFIYDIEHSQKKSSSTARSFRELQDIAKQFNAPIYYGRAGGKKTTLIK